MSVPSVWDLHEAFGAEVVELMTDRGLLLVIGSVGSGSRQLARALARRSALAVVLDPMTARAPSEVAAHIVRSLIAYAQPLAPERLGEPTREAQRFRVQVSRRYHDDAAEAVDIYAGAHAPGWTITRALGTPSQTPLIVLLEAHRLADTPVLWELRDLAARGQVTPLLTSRSHQQAQLVGGEAPFFGAMRTVLMPQLAPRDWMRAIDRPIAPADLDWLLERTRGRTATMLETLDARRPGSSPRDGWRRAARARMPHAEELLRVARTIHDFAPGLLLAIAAETAPYAAIEGARPNRVAKALRELHNLDLIEQPRPRRWQIADALLGEALRIIAERDRGLLARRQDGGGKQ